MESTVSLHSIFIGGLCKIGIGDPNIILLSIFEFRGNRSGKCCTSLMGINESTFTRVLGNCEILKVKNVCVLRYGVHRWPSYYVVSSKWLF